MVNELKSQTARAGNFYWYDNNWHYIRGWQHLKSASTLNSLSPDLKEAVKKQANKSFSASDAVMSRCISTLISLSWPEEQVKEKGKALVSAIKSAMSKQVV